MKLKLATGICLFMAAIFLAIPVLAQVNLQIWTTNKEVVVLANEFNAKQNDIKLQIRKSDFKDLTTDALRAYAIKKTPDLIAIDNPMHAAFASKGAFLDLTGRIAKSKVIDFPKIYPGSRATVMWKDKIYGVPKAVNTLCLYYNKDMFKKAGLDPNKPPETWAQLYEYAKKLNDPAHKVYGFAFSAIATGEGVFQFLPWVQMTGADYDSLNSPGALEALLYMKRFLDEGLSSKSVLTQRQWDMTGEFNAGRHAMIVGGPWELPRMTKTAKFNWGVAMLPYNAKYKKRASALGDFNYAIFSTTKHPEEAFKALEWLHSQSGRMWNEFGRLSPRSDMQPEKPRWPKAHAVFSEQMKYARARGPHPNWPKVATVIYETYQKAYTGQAEPKAALAEAAKRIKKYLK